MSSNTKASFIKVRECNLKVLTYKDYPVNLKSMNSYATDVFKKFIDPVNTAFGFRKITVWNTLPEHEYQFVDLGFVDGESVCFLFGREIKDAKELGVELRLIKKFLNVRIFWKMEASERRFMLRYVNELQKAICKALNEFIRLSHFLKSSVIRSQTGQFIGDAEDLIKKNLGL